MKVIIINSKIHGIHELIIDDQDYSLIKKYSWCVSKAKNTFYAIARVNGKNLRVHSLIMGQQKNGVVIDHKDGDGLNNRRKNLRVTTCSGNHKNRIKASHNTTGFKGVYFIKKQKKYWAYIKSDGIRFGGGLHPSPQDAAKKYNELAIKHHGEFARLNEI